MRRSVFLVILLWSSVVYLVQLLNINQNCQKSISPHYQAAVRAPTQPPDTGEKFEKLKYFLFRNLFSSASDMFFCNSNVICTERWDNDWYRGPSNIPRSGALGWFAVLLTSSADNLEIFTYPNSHFNFLGKKTYFPACQRICHFLQMIFFRLMSSKNV